MMDQNSEPKTRDLILIGGGHAHVQVIKMLRMKRPPDLRITLVNDGPTAYYSGMLPACIAGLYPVEDIQIELSALCHWAGVDFIQARVTGLDPEQRLIHLDQRPDINYDLLSLNVGSTTPHHHTPGAKEHTLSTRPLSYFMKHIESFENKLKDQDQVKVSVVGGGAAGVELAFAFKARFQERFPQCELSLIDRNQYILNGESKSTIQLCQKLLEEKGVHVLDQMSVLEVKPQKIVFSDGSSHPFDLCVWATGAVPADFLSETGLELDPSGFIKVNPQLQTSHPLIFAAGDCIAFEGQALPKAGVYAVREGPILAHNLWAALQRQAFKSYQPQTGFLSLLMTGDRKAVLNWKGWSAHGAWVWKLKDWIDQRFMNKFKVPVIDPEFGQSNQDQPAMPCTGCGSKMPSHILHDALGDLNIYQNKNVERGLDQPDDAAVVKLTEKKWSVQSIDYFPVFSQDLYLVGQVAVNHALSDVYAMGARAETAMALVNIARHHPKLQARDLKQLMAGVADACASHQVSLVGGHSTEGPETAIGLSVTGLVEPEHMLRKSGLQDGDHLILTKALGTGTLMAADMRARAKGRWLSAMHQSMLQSNRQAMEVFQQVGVQALTDVTGFGLAGHLQEMCQASQMGATITIDDVPYLEGARECLQQEIFSSLDPGNRALFHPDWPLRNLHHKKIEILFDPQTSGGLLAAVKPEQSASVVEKLRTEGCTQAAVIGQITESTACLEIS